MPQQCRHGRCENISHRTDGLCVKHATYLGKNKPKHSIQEAQQILAQLRADGWSLSAISEAAGVTENCLKFIAAGGAKRTRHSTVAALKSLIGTPITTGDRFPAWPTARRLRSLQAAGHGVSELADRTGLSATSLVKHSLGKSVSVSKRTKLAVDKVWREFEQAPVAGPPTYTAARMHWKAPMAWDNIDDPDESCYATASAITITRQERKLAQRILDAHPQSDWDFPITRDQIGCITRGAQQRVKASTLEFIYLRAELDKTARRHAKERANAA